MFLNSFTIVSDQGLSALESVLNKLNSLTNLSLEFGFFNLNLALFGKLYPADFSSPLQRAHAVDSGFNYLCPASKPEFFLIRIFFLNKGGRNIQLLASTLCELDSKS